MVDRQGIQWIRRHAVLAPFGISAATALLLYFAEQGQWRGRESWDLAAAMVDMGAVAYAMFAVLVDGGTHLMFYALQKRREWKEQREREREQLRAEALAEGRAEGRAEAEKKFNARIETLEELLRERGIDLDDLPSV